MKLFRKRNKSTMVSENQLLVRMTGVIERLHQRIAAYLGRKTGYWDRKSKIIALAIFCLLFGGISLFILINAIHHL
jgi:hypothetical protein